MTGHYELHLRNYQVMKIRLNASWFKQLLCEQNFDHDLDLGVTPV